MTYEEYGELNRLIYYPKWGGTDNAKLRADIDLGRVWTKVAERVSKEDWRAILLGFVDREERPGITSLVIACKAILYQNEAEAFAAQMAPTPIDSRCPYCHAAFEHKWAEPWQCPHCGKTDRDLFREIRRKVFKVGEAMKRQNREPGEDSLVESKEGPSANQKPIAPEGPETFTGDDQMLDEEIPF